MKRRDTSIALVAIGAGLTALGTRTVGIVVIVSGLYGLWHSNENEKTEKTCLDHFLTSVRSKAARRFSVTE